MSEKKTKMAKVDIDLPDGTKVSARGPMAEQMARRLLDLQPRWWPYIGWNGVWNGVCSNTGDTTSGYVAVTNSDGIKTMLGNNFAEVQEVIKKGGIG